MTIDTSLIIIIVLGAIALSGTMLVMWIADLHEHDWTPPLYGMSYCRICGKTAKTEYRSSTDDPPSNP